MPWSFTHYISLNKMTICCIKYKLINIRTHSGWKSQRVVCLSYYFYYIINWISFLCWNICYGILSYADLIPFRTNHLSYILKGDLTRQGGFTSAALSTTFMDILPALLGLNWGNGLKECRSKATCRASIFADIFFQGPIVAQSRRPWHWVHQRR